MTATTQPDVGTHQSAADQLERDRRAASERHALDIATTRGRDLADLSDVEFQEGLRRLKVIQIRVSQLLDGVLVENAHYGNPKNESGKLAFKKPILYKAGAEEIRRLMRLTLRRLEPDEIVATAEYCAVVVTLGIYDPTGRLLATRRGACSSLEGRFRKFGGSGGWVYDDPREKLHDLIAMAEKRAGVLLTSEVSGVTAFLAAEDTMDEAVAAEKPITPWTDTEKKLVYEEAQKKRMGRSTLERLTLKVLGRASVGTGEDVKELLAAIKAWEPEGRKKPEAEQAPAAPAPEPGDAAEDPELAFDQAIAKAEAGS